MRVEPGVIVYFYLHEGADPKGNLWPVPAIIYRRHNDAVVDLAVFGQQGPVNFERVGFCDQDEPKHKHWTFPPYVVVPPRPATLERVRR